MPTMAKRITDLGSTFLLKDEVASMAFVLGPSLGNSSQPPPIVPSPNATAKRLTRCHAVRLVRIMVNRIRQKEDRGWCAGAMTAGTFRRCAIAARLVAASGG